MTGDLHSPAPGNLITVSVAFTGKDATVDAAARRTQLGLAVVVRAVADEGIAAAHWSGSSMVNAISCATPCPSNQLTASIGRDRRTLRPRDLQVRRRACLRHLLTRNDDGLTRRSRYETTACSVRARTDPLRPLRSGSLHPSHDAAADMSGGRPCNSLPGALPL